jgi:SAM-dependent methyltransferase
VDNDELDLRTYIQDRYRSRSTPWFRWLFDQFQMPENCRILELGCGSGAFWHYNLEFIPPTWAITLSDKASEMVIAARKTLARFHRDFKFLRIDAGWLPFLDSSYDFVLANGLFDLLPDTTQTIGEVCRILRPRGVLAASTGGSDHLKELEVIVRGIVPEAKYGRGSSLFNLENGDQLLRSAFSAISKVEYRDTLTLQDINPLIVYARSEKHLQTVLSGENLLLLVNGLRANLGQIGSLNVTIHKGVFIAKRQ